MKKVLFVLLLVSFSSIAIAQVYGDDDGAAAKEARDYKKNSEKQIVSSTGFTVKKGDTLTLGAGTMPDGNFKFIRVKSSNLFSYTYTSTGGLANDANSLNREHTGLKYQVKAIDRFGNKKAGYVFRPKITIGIKNYEVDLDNAISTGEIVVPEQYRPKKEPTAVIVQQQTSVADELTKLKKLMDDGVLTKEEFEAQKKKLLEK